MLKTEDLIAFFFGESTLCFPGFGTLILERQDAKRNPVKNKIFGPKYTTSFIYNEINENALNKFLRYYSARNGVDMQIADDFIRKLSLDILNELGIKSHFELEGFGTFRKSEGKIIFEFSPVLSELHQMSYPDYPLLVVSREQIRTEEPGDSLVHPKESDGSSGKIIKKTGAILAGLSILTFLCFLFCISDIFQGNKDKVNADPKIYSSDKGETDTSDLAKDDMSVFGEDTHTAEIIAENRQINNSEISVINEVKKEKPGLNDLSALVNRAENNKKYFTETCIIIAGSFKNRSNAEKILKKIIGNGLRPFAEKYNSNYRVGAIFDMKFGTPEEHLDVMKNSIEINSWILQPKQE